MKVRSIDKRKSDKTSQSKYIRNFQRKTVNDKVAYEHS